MPLRELIRIDENRCNGCGLCVTACAEGAIELVDGKARLVSEIYCDGLGACLGECPEGAITIELVEAPPFDERAVAVRLASRKEQTSLATLPTLRPAAYAASRLGHAGPGSAPAAPQVAAAREPVAPEPSALRQWPVQLHLISPHAPHVLDAHLLLAADCVAFAVGDFHRRWLSGRSLAIACPKLDGNQEVYLDKLSAMVARGLRSLTVMVMEVPCCRGLLRLAQLAVAMAGRPLPITVAVVGVQGEILEVGQLPAPCVQPAS